MNMIDVAQGSPEWLQLRQSHSTASEAPAAMGRSKYQTRNALMKQKSTGLSEDVDRNKQTLFDRGHAAEAAARSIAEGIIGSDLYPVTATLTVDGIDLLASLDGATMDEEIIWEHKLYSASLAADILAGTLDPHYTIQLDQQLLVSDAKKCLFMTSDGTAENMVYCWYVSTPEKFDTLVAGWHQFHADRAAYVPTEIVAEAVGRTPETLPALTIIMRGEVSASNMEEFKQVALTAIRSVNRDLKTDQDFADSAKARKWCEDIETRVAAAKDHALGQTKTIDDLFRTMDEISAEARDVRLALEKLEKARKESRRCEIVAEGIKALADHFIALNTRLGKPYMPATACDFGGAIKGLRTFDSMQNAVDTALANAKISASATADRIDENLDTINRLAGGYTGMFPDAATLVLKAPDDFEATVKMRVSEQEKREQARLDAERERIRAEEQVKAQREAAEQAAKETQRIKDEAFLAGAQQREDARQAEMAGAVLMMRAEAEKKAQDAITAAQATPVPAQVPAQPMPATVTVRRLMDPLYPHIEATAAPETPPTLKIGQINERLHPVQISAQGLSMLGFNPAGKAGASVLFHESSFPLICAALVQHIQDVCQVAA